VEPREEEEEEEEVIPLKRLTLSIPVENGQSEKSAKLPSHILLDTLYSFQANPYIFRLTLTLCLDGMVR